MTTDKAKIALVGAGRMGRCLAHAFAYCGHAVALIDVKQRSADDARQLFAAAAADIGGTLGFLAGLDIMSEAEVAAAMARITYHTADEHDAAVAAADYITEGVPEVLAIKEPVLKRASAAARPDAIIASTTSTISVIELAAFVTGPERFLNTHWLNPGYLIPLVEVSPGPATAPEVHQRTLQLLESVGKKPVTCAPGPGYIIPRLQSMICNESVRMVEEGVASAEDIDKAVRYGIGVRYANMGTIEFIDWGGLDILYYASKYLVEALGSDRYASPDIVARYMKEGRLGPKTGKGIYENWDRDLKAYERERLTGMVRTLQHQGLMPPPGGVDPDDTSNSGR